MKTKKSLKKMGRISFLGLIFAVLFSLFQVLSSSETMSLSSCQANLVSKEIEDHSPNGVVLVSRSKQFPALPYLGETEVGYYFNYYYTTKQKTFYCAIPEDGFYPFSMPLSSSKSLTPVPFLSLPVSGSDGPETVDFLASLMFGDAAASPAKGDSGIYITQDSANSLLGIEKPTESDYRTLIGKSLSCQITKNRTPLFRQYNVLDILVASTYQDLVPFFGNRFVIGGYNAVTDSAVEGMEIESLLYDDFYSNQRFLKAFFSMFDDKESFVSSFRSFPDGVRTKNTIAEKASSYYKKSVSLRMGYFAFMAIFFILAVVLWVSFALRKPDEIDIVSSPVSFYSLTVISFSVATLFCVFLRKHLILAAFPCLSTPVGVFISFLLSLDLAILFFFVNDTIDDKKKENFFLYSGRRN